MNRRFLSVPAVALTAVLVLGACSDDSPDQGSRLDDAATADTALDDPALEDTDGDTGGGTGLVPGGGFASDLETFGFAIESAMEDVTGYDVDGSTLRIRIDGVSDPSNDACMIVRMVAGSVTLPDGATVEVEYDDTVDDCGV